MNQSWKIFAYSLAGAGLLAMNILASTACSAEATAGSGSTATGGSSSGGSSAGGSTATGGSSAGGSSAGGSSAGGAAAGGDTGAGGEAAGGSGGSTGGIGQRFSEAVGAMDAAKCQACVDGMSGDAGGGMFMCSGSSAACDGDADCKAMVEQVGANREGKPMDPADCWVTGAVGSSPNDTTNGFAVCVSEKCGAECGGLTAGFSSTCPLSDSGRLSPRRAGPQGLALLLLCIRVHTLAPRSPTPARTSGDRATA